MLGATLLNPTATVNDYEVISSLQFIPGEVATLIFQLKQTNRNDQLRYFPEAGSTLSIKIPRKDGDIETIAAAELTGGDRSIWKATLSAAITAEIPGGNFTFTLTEPTGPVVQEGFVDNGLSLVITGAC